jgi:PAS domain-containing protein
MREIAMDAPEQMTRASMEATTVAATQEHLGAVIDMLPSGLVVVDAHGRAVLLNEAARRILGCDADPTDHVCQERASDANFWLDAGTGKKLTTGQLPLARALRGERVHNAHLLFRCQKETATRHLWVSAAPLWTDGQIRGAVSSFTDSTEEWQLQRDLASSKQLLQAVLDTAPLILFGYDPNGRLLLSGGAKLDQPNTRFTEPSLVERLGRSSEALEGMRHALDGKPATLTLVQDDTTLEMRCTPWYHQSGTILGGVGVIADVTARRQAEEGMSWLYTIPRVLAASSTLDDAVTALLGTVCMHLSWDIGAFWTLDGDTGALRCRHFYHVPGVSTPWLEMLTLELALLPYEDLVGRVWTEGTPTWVPDVSVDPSFKRMLPARKEGIHAGVTVPILVDGVVRAVMEFFSRTVSFPDKDTLAILGAISAQVEQVLARLDAQHTLRESERRLSVLVSNAPIILFSVDQDGLITLYEGCALQALGHMPGEAVGRSVFDVYRNYPDILACVRRALAGEAGAANVCIGERVFDVRCIAERVGGRVVGVSGVATEISMCVRADDAPRARRKAAACMTTEKCKRSSGTALRSTG